MTGISTLGQSLSQIKQLKNQQVTLDRLATQLNTGKKTQRFAGLNNDVLATKRARADFRSLDTYIQNTKNGNIRMELMLNAIEEVQAQSRIFGDRLLGFSQETVHQKGDEIIYDDPLTPFVETKGVGVTSADPDGDFAGLMSAAEDLFNVVTNLVNIQEGDQYLLGGADILTKPLGNTDGLQSAIGNLIDDWKSGAISNDDLIASLTTDNTAANPNALTDTVIGFSSALSSDNVGKVTVRASENVEVDYTVKANADPFRDILVGLSFIMNEGLPPIADAYIPPNAYPGTPDVEGAPGDTLDSMKDNFFTVFNSIQAMVEEAIKDIDPIRFRVESSRARIQELQIDHAETQAFLGEIISDVEDVDLTEIGAAVSALSIQIEASYAVTGRIQQLSLVNFL